MNDDVRPSPATPALGRRLRAWVAALMSESARHWVFTLTRPTTLGVRVIVEDSAGRVLLVRHSYQPGWHLPGGGVEHGESVRDAVVKELAEEAQIVVTPGAPRLLGVFANQDVSARDHIVLFHVSVFARAAPAARDPEIAERRWCDPDALPRDTQPGVRRRLADLRAGTPPPAVW